MMKLVPMIVLMLVCGMLVHLQETPADSDAAVAVAPAWERQLVRNNDLMVRGGDVVPGDEEEAVLLWNPVSGSVTSGCAGSWCLGSGCGGSGCFGSACVGSACGGSACVGSGCGGSVCVGSGCFGSVCVGSGCLGSVCEGDSCKRPVQQLQQASLAVQAMPWWEQFSTAAVDQGA